MSAAADKTKQIIKLAPTKLKRKIEIPSHYTRDEYLDALAGSDQPRYSEEQMEIDPNAAVMGFNRQRYQIATPRYMLDSVLRLKAWAKKDVVIDAIHQAFRKLHPERKNVEIEVSCRYNAEDERYAEYDLHIWWNHRRQYLQLDCWVRD